MPETSDYVSIRREEYNRIKVNSNKLLDTQQELRKITKVYLELYEIHTAYKRRGFWARVFNSRPKMKINWIHALLLIIYGIKQYNLKMYVNELCTPAYFNRCISNWSQTEKTHWFCIWTVHYPDHTGRVENHVTCGKQGQLTMCNNIKDLLKTFIPPEQREV